MPRNSALLIAAVLCAGCTAPTKRVYIDLNAVLASTREIPVAAPTPPNPPATIPAFNLALPGQPAKRIPDRSNASGPEVRKLIVAAQQQAQADLESRLKSVYDNQVNRFSLELERKRSQSDQAASDEASN